MSHIPVLLNEAIKFLDPQAGDFIIDGTVGGGGHGIAILEKISPKGILLGIDLDSEAVVVARERIATISKSPEAEQARYGAGKFLISKVVLEQGNYADLPKILKKLELPKAKALLLDLGFSSKQIEESGRGFSFLRDEPLDMRYCQTTDYRLQTTAEEIINSFNGKDLADIFYEYGEERFARKIAKKIVEARRKKRILTTFDLVNIIKQAVPISYQKGRIHFATRTFQALRIYVNDELGNLERLLNSVEDIVKKDGRVVIISFHSLEDRIVKNYFRKMAKEKKAEILTKKPIVASREEVLINSRARSAKLRAIRITGYL